MKAHVRPHNGTPTLFLNGQPAYANIHLIGGLDPTPEGWAITEDAIRRYAANDIHIYSIDAAGDEWYGPRLADPDQFDYTPTAGRLQKILAVDPAALFLLRISFDTKFMAGNWWNLENPDEVDVMSDGQRLSASFASVAWHQRVQRFLRGYIAHLREAGLYDCVIAYQLCTGTCGEWIKDWSSMSPPSGDFSPAMQHRFRAWLREHYHGDVAVLQAAWADPAVTFETAQVPSGEIQAATTHFLFRDPSRERQTIDFYDCYAEVAAEALLSMCRAVKDATQGEKLTGAFFGYLMDLAWNNCFFNDNTGDLAGSEVSTVQRSGHLGLNRLLRSPDFDFVLSPYSYAFRGIGGDGLPMQPTESVRLHGKLYLFEEDTLMHNNFDPQGRMQPKDKSIPIYHRNFAQVLTHGLGITWMESSYFVEDPRVLPEMRRWHKCYDLIGRWALQLDRKPSADVAVFLDDESFRYESNRNNIDLPLIAHQRVVSLNRFGAPHDLYLLQDLLEGDLPPYRLYIFLNAFHLDNARRQRLHQILGQGDRTALWYYAPGYLNSDAPAPAHTDNMTGLTGFNFHKSGSYWSLLMHLTNFKHPITQGLSQEMFWGSTRNLGPIFHLADPEATILGEVVYGLGRCQPGLGLKTYQPDGAAQPFTSIYAATPNLPSAVLRGLARHAGAHIYNGDGDVLYATPDLLSAHTVSGGPRTFDLPRKVEVVHDLLNNRPLARDTAQFCDELPPESTALYYTGSAAVLDSLKLPSP
jgi:hypothetical protein